MYTGIFIRYLLLLDQWKPATALALCLLWLFVVVVVAKRSTKTLIYWYLGSES